MVRKSLHTADDYSEIIGRIEKLKPDSNAKWGRMDAAQMLAHCTIILKVATHEVQLPEINFLLKIIGISTKKEMWLLNNGIPPNMPTFEAVKVKEICDFIDCKMQIFNTLEDFLIISKESRLPMHHPLFGKMDEKDWGFLQYKHLDHHLKQFGL